MMTFVIIAGEIDLSVASVMGLSAAVLATLNDGGSVPFGVAILIAVAAGSAAGLVQGWCVSRLGLPSLVVTLAGLIGLRGLARVFVEDRSYGGFPVLVREPRPGAVDRPVAVQRPVVRRGHRRGRRGAGPHGVGAAGVCRRRQRRRRPVLGTQRGPPQTRVVRRLRNGCRRRRAALCRPPRLRARRHGHRVRARHHHDGVARRCQHLRRRRDDDRSGAGRADRPQPAQRSRAWPTSRPTRRRG